jgi:hypothetical protein
MDPSDLILEDDDLDTRVVIRSCPSRQENLVQEGSASGVLQPDHHLGPSCGSNISRCIGDTEHQRDMVRADSI